MNSLPSALLRSLRLAPLALILTAAHAGDPTPPVIVDVHTHVFNARDIPVGGFMRAQGIPARVFAPVVELLTLFASDYVPPGTIRARNFTPAELNRVAELTAEDKAAIEAYLGVTNTTHARAMAPGQPMVLDDGRRVDPRSLALAEALLARANFPPSETAPAVPDRPGAPPRAMAVSVSEGLSFVRLMLRDQQAIARNFRDTYPGVDLALHHMMDLAATYGDRPANEFTVQMRRMDALEAEPGLAGKLVHFVAFDPFRGDSALALLRATADGPLRGRALGVKFYPPCGYRATDNAIEEEPDRSDYARHEQWASRYLALGADNPARNRKLDEIIEGLFAFCEEFDVPVFSHCTGLGAEAVPGYGMNCDPAYWRKVLDRHPGLRLCLGHAGGEPWWFGTGETPPANLRDDEKRRWSFGREVTRLCLDFKNVYCEVGYLDAAKGGSPARDRFVARLKAAAALPSADGQHTFADRIMYGSDWHMTRKEDFHRAYLKGYLEIFAHPDLQACRTRFFGANAVRFLKLRNAATDLRFSPEQRAGFSRLIARLPAEP